MEQEKMLGRWKQEDFIDHSSNLEVPLEQDPWTPVADQGGLLPNLTSNFEIGAPEFDIPDDVTWDIDDLNNDEFALIYCKTPDELEDIIEPEPLTDAISDLKDPQFPPDDSITDISCDLKIGEFLSKVPCHSQEQQDKCRSLLSECGTNRLRFLIPWLRTRDWRGEKLQLFLEFRNLWELTDNLRWWEIHFWNDSYQDWAPEYYKGTLTLDHTWELVENRTDCNAEDMIDQRWFNEWEAHAPWEYGIQSFASFAVFRASVLDAADWLEYLVPTDCRSALEIAQCADPSFAPFMLPSEVRLYSCPDLVEATDDPWSDVTDTAYHRATALGYTLVCAWEEVISELMTDY